MGSCCSNQELSVLNNFEYMEMLFQQGYDVTIITRKKKIDVTCIPTLNERYYYVVCENDDCLFNKEGIKKYINSLKVLNVYQSIDFLCVEPDFVEKYLMTRRLNSKIN